MCTKWLVTTEATFASNLKPTYRISRTHLLNKNCLGDMFAQHEDQTEPWPHWRSSWNFQKSFLTGMNIKRTSIATDKNKSEIWFSRGPSKEPKWCTSRFDLDSPRTRTKQIVSKSPGSNWVQKQPALKSRRLIMRDFATRYIASMSAVFTQTHRLTGKPYIRSMSKCFK